MPFRQVEVPPEVFLEHAGVTVYRTYRNDDIDEPRTFLFGLSPEVSDDSPTGDHGHFDVRELPAEILARHPGVNEGEDVAIRGAIREAIDNNTIPYVDVSDYRQGAGP